jgi:hypothetical protein
VFGIVRDDDMFARNRFCKRLLPKKPAESAFGPHTAMAGDAFFVDDGFDLDVEVYFVRMKQACTGKKQCQGDDDKINHYFGQSGRHVHYWNWFQQFIPPYGASNHDKSWPYEWDMTDPSQVEAFWAFHGGRGTLLLSPVTVQNPDNATKWFHSHQGQTWNYNVLINNCSDYVVEGLKVGGAVNADKDGPWPSEWMGNYTKSWSPGAAGPVDIKPVPGYKPPADIPYPVE